MRTIFGAKSVVWMAACLLATTVSAAPAQSWQLIAGKGGERLELDKSRISRLKTGQSAAWSRLTLGFDLPDTKTGINYTAIEALNTYDCSKREYTTLRRVYLSGGKAIREESVSSPQTLSINSGSFEDKLLSEVCKPRSVGEMKQVAELAAQLMNPSTEPTAPTAMQADMRSEEKSGKPAVVQVSDPAPGSKPRMIELPKIDKSQVEDPYANSRPPAAEAKKAAEPARKPEPALAPQVVPQAAPALPPSGVTTLSAYERSLIERQLATTGPRRAAARPKKVEEKHEAHIHWAYEGDGGPANWGKLQADYALCSNGKRQSPIDIRDGIKVDLENIQFNYKPSTFSVIDNGHTVQVSLPEGSSIKVMERTFNLLQFHFHRPSEETVNGRRYDMVAHLVHKSDEGQLAVIALLVEKGAEHPVIQTVWNNLPLEQGMLVSPSATIDLAKLLPESRAYWTYMGSLTTPPCSEGVLWMVMKQPIQLSPEQVGIFGRLYRNNARPVQPSNGRLIKENR